MLNFCVVGKKEKYANMVLIYERPRGEKRRKKKKTKQKIEKK